MMIIERDDISVFDLTCQSSLIFDDYYIKKVDDVV